MQHEAMVDGGQEILPFYKYHKRVKEQACCLFFQILDILLSHKSRRSRAHIR